ncbi:MAG: hypothetical protein HXY43_04300 [Fischerella sp.]|jgi:hypothetical protein|nr:hypothetical protein [Fischerella sp.]NWF58536.1 hypothetical protein [Fischerella sp.]
MTVEMQPSIDLVEAIKQRRAARAFKQYGGRFGIEQVCFGESYGESFRLS